MQLLKSALWILPLLVIATAGVANAQISGTVVIDPGGGGDYLDFEAMRVAMESNTLTGNVICEVVPGTYNAGWTTPFGAITYNTPGSDSLTIRPQAGGAVIVNGNTDPFIFNGATYVTLMGLEITNFDHMGVQVFSASSFIVLDGLHIHTSGTFSGGSWPRAIGLESSSNVTIRNCELHGAMLGIGLNNTAGTPTNVYIYNNFLYSFDESAVGGWGAAGIVNFTAGLADSLIANNTYYDAVNGSGGFWAGILTQLPATWTNTQIINNIFKDDGAASFGIYMFSGTLDPTSTINYNLYHMPTSGTVAFDGTTAHATVAAFNGATGYEANGVEGDPNLVNIAAGTEDLHINQPSPAEDVGVDIAAPIAITDDIDGDARQSPPEIGADEILVAGPEMDVQRPAGTSIADGGNDALGNVAAGVPLQYTYTIANTGTLDLTLTTPITVTANNNCTASCSTQPTSPVLPAGTTTFVIDLTVTAVGAFDFDISIANNDANENPYNFNVAGTGAAVPEIDVQRPAGTSIPSGNTDNIGNATTGSNTDVTYTIANQGTAALTLTGVAPDYVTLSAPTNCTAIVLTQPTTPVLAAGTTTFVVRVNPTADGVFSVVVTILNDDADEGTYTFTISGTGVTGGAGGGGGCCGVTDQAGSRGNLALTFVLAIVLMTLYFVRRRFVA